MTLYGRIFDMQRFCTHDGPGIRTTVFLKGCPLSCLWCSNPESHSFSNQLLFFSNLCRGCGKCISVCPEHCITESEGQIFFDRAHCKNCGACASVCPHEARSLSGKNMTVEEVEAFVRQDWQYYMQDNGGITFSGGEPLAQPEFLRAILTRLHDDLGYHTCIETTGYTTWKIFSSMLPHLSMVIMDIKHMNSEKHKSMTGVDNLRILENARLLSKTGKETLIRIPLIPQFNDTEENIHAMGAFLRDQKFPRMEIMPYHSLGKTKYDALGWTYQEETLKPQTDRSAEILRSYGLDVLIHM